MKFKNVVVGQTYKMKSEKKCRKIAEEIGAELSDDFIDFNEHIFSLFDKEVKVVKIDKTNRKFFQIKIKIDSLWQYVPSEFLEMIII